MKTVMIVEDDAGLRTEMAGALSGDYLVRGFAGGREAADSLGQDQVDAILLDMVLPGGDGWIVLARAANLPRRPCVVVLGGGNEPAKVVKAMKLGASDYLVKPSELGAIRAAIHRVLSSTPSNAAFAAA